MEGRAEGVRGLEETQNNRTKKFKEERELKEGNDWTKKKY